ncbi:hypothetical protein VC83_08368 [Pseudogymnoascus destructans]|uniref:CCHC-type domain-containing protein n=1 Tax=Pseudogymnoascus destructans TaxID=655981 RepID=A0A176ZZM1_9PEZI|nr:uncharacterized protein VC83_08368 [Pseudogymnoascus destructans]OAF55469.1 hypothetical protein VC83_08368 [Pseudogymnoascus destructans]
MAGISGTPAAVFPAGPKFANGPAQDVQAFVEAVSWKHRITRAQFEKMSVDEKTELDEFLVLYLFSKLDGEPAQWWANLSKDQKVNFKKVSELLLARYGWDEVCQKRSQWQGVAAELNNLHQHPGFANVLRALMSREDMSFLQILDTVIDMQGPTYVEKKPDHEETVEESKSVSKLMKTMAYAMERSQGFQSRGNSRNNSRLQDQGSFLPPHMSQPQRQELEYQPYSGRPQGQGSLSQFQVQHYEQCETSEKALQQSYAPPPQYQALHQVQQQRQAQWGSSAPQFQGRTRAQDGQGYRGGNAKTQLQCFKCAQFGHYALDCMNAPASESAQQAAHDLANQRCEALDFHQIEGEHPFSLARVVIESEETSTL